MKRNFIITILISAINYGCSSLNVREIKSMEKMHFQNMKLCPAQEHNELRIDVIRQITESYVDGTTTYYEDVPYHPLGLDLGNGLFYDMNGNLSFRLDYLLEFDPEKPFELNKHIKPENQANNFLYTYINEALAETRLPQRNSKVLYHKEVFVDSMVYMRKDRFRYAISSNDSSFSYTYRNNKPLQIIKVNENNYYTFRRKKLREFSNVDNTLILGKTFTIRLSNDKNTITINSPWRERYNKRARLTIQKDANGIFIYSKGYRGKKIEFTESGLFVTGTKLKPTLYKKIVGSESVSAQFPIYE